MYKPQLPPTSNKGNKSNKMKRKSLQVRIYHLKIIKTLPTKILLIIKIRSMTGFQNFKIPFLVSSLKMNSIDSKDKPVQSRINLRKSMINQLLNTSKRSKRYTICLSIKILILIGSERSSIALPKLSKIIIVKQKGNIISPLRESKNSRKICKI